jgi:LuxR family maltose regulon positive regulatory protein
MTEALNDLPNPLTAREMELLELLPTRSTSAEIAARWYVSVNTVKTHLGHVYRKLDVADRTGAIARAQELGLLVDQRGT